ncbi:hypothetical protein HBH56_063700 [Parastagonospora nodorum]|uniref:Uncharacterized protein n=1 Tax=Phaeosphaeria nodorum (strain SN15 / ATCC MYA-4574 / FGSC 10173) TaxID=321614 RepID=A0A7U2ESB3_PHANO|nr:hypothetical protein HBH56_063700 [Parastagonospora nodorum]QRC92170.1 hypothetical protein JI435_023190 [Parastagonospora nodorum SN15]KAH3930997.1 hypothetical protein HBH54_107640 [Parastagonospora nodorum]KAH3954401.1 hypothetical protein HBH53_022730 [Parastagonospora nodorum]KAH3999849.1 hypothetical protein HBI10_105020 [Parastagonospora nodorum]
MATLAQFDGIVLVEYITPAFNTIQPPTDSRDLSLTVTSTKHRCHLTCGSKQASDDSTYPEARCMTVPVRPDVC